jgi:glycosyltransferase involved in cell wall biosynthesis
MQMNKQRDLRILWSSNAVFSSSGYANQSRDILYRLLKDDWKVAQSAFYGLEGGTIELDGLRIYPRLGDTWGGDAMVLHGQHWKADITISFQDSWVLDSKFLRRVNRYIPYVPIDHDPVPPVVIEKMKFAERIITYSEFGRKRLAEAGFASDMIPHGVDTDIFKPMDKKEARKSFGLDPDMFLFGMISANKDNPPRKSFQEVMDAFSVFKREHPKSGLYFHVLLDNPTGFPIKQYAARLGIEDSIFFLDNYTTGYGFSHDMVAKLMNAFDCLLIPSNSEGFGMPCTEAQACGVPVIANNFTALPDLLVDGETGFLVDILSKRFSLQLSYAGIPSTEDIYRKMELVYNGDRKAMGKAGRQFILKNFDIDKLVAQKWTPLLEQIQENIYATD